MEVVKPYTILSKPYERFHAAVGAPCAPARSHAVKLLHQRTALARNNVYWQQASVTAPTKACLIDTSSFAAHDSCLEPLQQLFNAQQYEDLVARHPEVLTCVPSSPVYTWVEFLDQYGLERSAISKLLLQCPELVTCTSIYEAGRTLLFFIDLGWTYEQIRGRIISQYPQVLAKQLERDIQPVLQELMLLGCTPPDIKLLVWEYPRIFTVGKDYRRHIRKFQYLGLYGLSLPSRTSTSSSSGSSRSRSRESSASGSESDGGSDSDGYCSRGVRDSLEWLLMTVQN